MYMLLNHICKKLIAAWIVRESSRQYKNRISWNKDLNGTWTMTMRLSFALVYYIKNLSDQFAGTSMSTKIFSKNNTERAQTIIILVEKMWYHHHFSMRFRKNVVVWNQVKYTVAVLAFFQLAKWLSFHQWEQLTNLYS